AAEALHPLLDPAPASEQLSRLSSFLAAHIRQPDGSRERRAQAAILSILSSMADAYAAHDDRPVVVDELAADIRRWIGGETVVPETGDTGVDLLDARAARYGGVDGVFVVGLMQGEWPELPRPSL